MKPTIGRIVHYRLSEQDAKEINRRRTHSGKIAEQIALGNWSIGAQAHLGNEVQAGQVFPMMIVAVWSEECVNGQVFLDGTDSFWALSRNIGESEYNWFWPVIG